MCWRRASRPHYCNITTSNAWTQRLLLFSQMCRGGNKRPLLVVLFQADSLCVEGWLLTVSLGGRQWEPRILTPRLLYLESCALRGAEGSWTHRSKISRWIHKQLSCLFVLWTNKPPRLSKHIGTQSQNATNRLFVLLCDGAVKHLCERSGGKRCYSRLLHRACLGEAMFDFKCHI